MMTSNTTLSTLLLLSLVTLFILINSPATTFAAEDDPMGAGNSSPKPKDEPYKVVKEFCHQRRYKKDREFCLRALKSYPRSASAKDIIALLHISVDLGVGNTKKTRHYLTTLSKDPKTKQPLLTALKECISAYDWGIGELKIIPRELQDDPALASYDALMASDALQSCQDSLNRNNITVHSILKRHNIATAYVRLCVDIAMNI